jgi:hypothetical protein
LPSDQWQITRFMAQGTSSFFGSADMGESPPGCWQHPSAGKTDAPAASSSRNALELPPGRDEEGGPLNQSHLWTLK